MNYFGYGSNMSKKRLEEQNRNGQAIGAVNDLGICKLQNYKIEFNKLSRDGSGKTNIIEGEGPTFGVLFELSDIQKELLTTIEIGYEIKDIKVEFNGEVIDAYTFIASEASVQTGLLPTVTYLNYLIDGAIEHDFPKDYIEMLQAQNYFGKEDFTNVLLEHWIETERVSNVESRSFLKKINPYFQETGFNAAEFERKVNIGLKKVESDIDNSLKPDINVNN